MKTVIEYETSEFPGYTLFFFYVRKKIDKEWCWIHDNEPVLEHEALKKYPKNKYEWLEYSGD